MKKDTKDAIGIAAIGVFVLLAIAFGVYKEITDIQKNRAIIELNERGIEVRE